MTEGTAEARGPIPTWLFVVVVVRRNDQYLVVHESKDGQKWYLPAGRVEPGEDFKAAAWRETMEEAGIAVEIDGVLRIEQLPMKQGLRMRVFLTAHPVDDSPLKSEADEESLGAQWATVPQIAELPLRDPEVLEVCGYVQTGGFVGPVDMLTREGAAFL